MYNGSFGKSSPHAQPPREDSSPSNQRNPMRNIPSSGSASGPELQFAIDGDVGCWNGSNSILQQGMLNTLLQGNPGSYYSAGPYESNLSNATATPSLQGSAGPYDGLPTPPNVPSGQLGNPGAQVTSTAQPPTMTWPPEVFAMPNEGIPDHFWNLYDAKLDYQGGDFSRVVLYFKKKTRFP